MAHPEKKHRIIFIDLMRTFAVLQMVQGHTIDVLLANNYRHLDNPFFAAWFFMRGMTAPIFMFTAGTVFTYLFRLVREPFNQNPRVKKGFKRVILLVVLGYLLRYPTASLIDFSQVTPEQWNIFFAVDVLQSIGFGILFLVLLAILSEKVKLNDYWIFGLGALFFFILFPIFQQVNWKSFLPLPLAGYFYEGTGSNFPLFPWAGFVISGGILGSYLAKKPLVFKTAKFSLNLLLFGILLIILAYFESWFEGFIGYKGELLSSGYSLILLRIGIVLVLNAIVSFISLKVETIPKVFILIGRNTLLIYIVHLMILYGSAWNLGLINLFDKTFTLLQSITTAIVMISLMTAMVLLINKFKIRNKQLVT